MHGGREVPQASLDTVSNKGPSGCEEQRRTTTELLQIQHKLHRLGQASIHRQKPLLCSLIVEWSTACEEEQDVEGGRCAGLSVEQMVEASQLKQSNSATGIVVRSLTQTGDQGEVIVVCHNQHSRSATLPTRASKPALSHVRGEGQRGRRDERR